MCLLSDLFYDSVFISDNYFLYYLMWILLSLFLSVIFLYFIFIIILFVYYHCTLDLSFFCLLYNEVYRYEFGPYLYLIVYFFYFLCFVILFGFILLLFSSCLFKTINQIFSGNSVMAHGAIISGLDFASWINLGIAIFII